MKVAFGTVVYQMAYNYCQDYIDAVNQQDTNDFDILLLNDDLDEEECRKLTNQIKQKVVWAVCEINKTIPELKIELVKAAKEKGYDLLILGDFDDAFSENRISKTILNYDTVYSFYYNELLYLDKINSLHCVLPETVKDIDSIIESNFLGFSNTALNLNKINHQFLSGLKAKQTTAFDWMVFSLLLLQGHRGKKIEDCKTYYRIHEHNIAGEPHLSLEGYKKEIEVKVAHYAKLADIDARYCDLLKYYNGLKNLTETDFIILKTTLPNGYWWGSIKRIIRG